AAGSMSRSRGPIARTGPNSFTRPRVTIKDTRRATAAGRLNPCLRLLERRPAETWKNHLPLGLDVSRSVKAAAIQMRMHEDVGTNRKRCVEMIHQAADRGASLVVTPELFGSLYFCQREDAAFFD